MRRAWFVLVVLALAGFAGPAQAQAGGGFVSLGLPGTKVLSETSIPVHVSGELSVSFHGDAGAGCASYGLCSYSGVILVRPRGGDLTIDTYRRGGRIGRAAILGLGPAPGPGQPGSATFARVQRSIPGSAAAVCADSHSSFFSTVQVVESRGGSFTIRLLAPGGSLLQTRCASPLDGDLAGAGPSVTIPVSRALRGGTVLDLSDTRAFAVHGFAGTIDSSLVIRLGRPQPGSSSSGPSFPPGIKVQRIRTVTEQLSLVRVNGQLTAAVQGTTDPIVCRLLDTCGLSGTLSLGRVGKGANAQVVAVGPANRPYRDFLTALQLTRGGNSRGIQMAMFVSLTAGVRADVGQAGITCRDTSGAGGVAVSVGSLFGGSLGGGGFAGSWRTRCPGPALGAGPGGFGTSLAPGALGHHQFALAVRASGSFSDDGYVISPHGRLSIVLRRGPITQQVATQPVP